MLGTRWKRIDEARKLLGLPQKTSRREIQEAYRRCTKRLHPDHNQDQGTEEELAKMNSAYRLLMDFCDNYQMDLSFNEAGMTEEEWWFHHFGNDPVWGPQS